MRLKIWHHKNIKLVLIVVFALSLRLWRLLSNYPIFIDEEWYVSWSEKIMKDGLHSRVHYQGNNYLILYILPPLNLLTLSLVFEFVGVGYLQARIMTFLFGCLVVLLTYLLAKELFDERTALAATLLLSISPVAITYSSTVLLGPMMLFFELLSIIYFLRADTDNNPKQYFISGILASLALLTKQFAIILYATVILYVIFRKRRKFIHEKGLWIFLSVGIIMEIIYLAIGLVVDPNSAYFGTIGHITGLHGHGPTHTPWGFWTWLRFKTV
ncbi:MAG: ArnT family glycosyltransferase, partial [Candidatus Hodarchaeota archaeon]